LEYLTVFQEALVRFGLDLAYYIPKLIIAYVIWLVGKYFLSLAVRFMDKVDVKQTNLDDKAFGFLKAFVIPLGKVLLFFVVLDYLGIGRTVIGALLSALTMAIGITVGISFGRALEREARQVIDSAKTHWQG